MDITVAGRFRTLPQPVLHWVAGLSVISAAAITGMLIARYPWVILPVAAISGVFSLITVRDQTEHIFLVALTVLLFGFMFYSKAFAYIGLPPFYISELVLALGLLCLVIGRTRGRWSGSHTLIVAFWLLGVLRTAPYIMTYGLDALRDAATWYYASFAVIVSGLLTGKQLVIFLSRYARLALILPLWLAMMSVFFPLAPSSLGKLESTSFPIFYLIKAGDRAVILVGLAAFVISGLYTRFREYHGFEQVVFWTLWSLCALSVVVRSRGGMLALAVALLVLVWLRPSRQLVQAGILGALLISTMLLINPTINLGGPRAFSIEQIRANVLSVFTNESGNSGAVQSTKEWRLQWWGNIIDQTFEGPYFWTGQGFGLNLADEYGFQTDAAHSLRSPHSIHMTILARMGVPGFILWVAINVSFAIRLIRLQRVARQRGGSLIADIAVWLLAIWAAALVNGSFDVYLESPYGAIPFWCVIGTGIALPAILDRREHARPARSQSLSGTRWRGREFRGRM